MFGLEKYSRGSKHERMHRHNGAQGEHGRFSGVDGGRYRDSDRVGERYHLVQDADFLDLESEYCPLCRNHCLLGEPACPRGAAFVLQHASSSELDMDETGLEWHESIGDGKGWGRDSPGRVTPGRAFRDGKFLRHKGKYMDSEETMHGQGGYRNSLTGLFRRMLKHMARAFHHHGHRGHAQKRVLAILREKENISQRELMEYLGVRSASLSELLAKLEHNGLITRDREEYDRRSYVITITESGRAAVAGYEEERRGREDLFFSSLTAEERQQLTSILGKLVEALDSESSDDHPHGRHGHRGYHSREHGHFGRRHGRHDDFMGDGGQDREMCRHAHSHEGHGESDPEGHHDGEDKKHQHHEDSRAERHEKDLGRERR